MSVLVTGGTGLVGRFIVEGLLARGESVVVAGRTAPAAGFFTAPVIFRPFDLSMPPVDWQPLLAGVDALVHAGFEHLPGRYRGGEGDRPDAFLKANAEGSAALFAAARDARIRRCVFISSRAVYGTQPPGQHLSEETPPRPDTLYGAMKRSVEDALRELCGGGFTGVSLRATGVYGPPGPGRHHKWDGLFADFCAGRPIAPRCASEVHGRDLGEAVLIALNDAPESAHTIFNVSDILVERRDILAVLAGLGDIRHTLPDRQGTGGFNAMTTERLTALGWRPGGRALFDETVRALADAFLQRKAAG